MDDPQSAMFNAMTAQPGGLFAPSVPLPPNDLGGLFGNNPGMSLVSQLFVPGLMGQFGMLPGQFFPHQSLMQQQESRLYWQEQRQALQIASAADRGMYSSLTQGVMRGVFGGPLTPEQAGTANTLAGFMADTAAPFLIPMFPQTFDALGGIRGSQGVMALNAYVGMRQMADPVTGMPGMTGASLGAMTSGIYERLYGPGADVAAMRGITAGQVGSMMTELGARGMLPGSVGMMRPDEQLRQLSSQAALEGLARNDPAAFRTLTDRMAATIPGLRDLAPTDAAGVLAGRGSETRAVLDDLRKLDDPAFASAMRNFDAGRVSTRLKEMSGAVAAMVDIMGPDKPMSQLLAGLDTLTQGGMTTMDPARLQRTVRTMAEMANNAGVSPDALLGLSAMGAADAARLGIDPSFVPQITTGAMGFGQAFGLSGAAATPNFFAQDREKMTLMDQRLRARAAASDYANSLGAAARASDALRGAGVALTGPAAALLAAAEAGQETFVDPATGERRSVFMGGQQMIDVLAASGMDRDTASRLVRDREANEESIQRHDLAGVVRGGQRQEARRYAQRVEAGTIAGALRARGMGQDQARATADRAADMLSRLQMGETVRINGEDVEGMTPKQRRDNVQRNRYLAGVLGRIDPSLGAMSEADRALLAENMVGDLHENLRRSRQFSGYNALTIFELHDPRIMAEARRQEGIAADEGRISSMLAGVGRLGPLGRLAEVIRSGDGDIGKAIAGVAGGIDPEEVRKRILAGAKASDLDPNSRLSVMLGEFAKVNKQAEAARGIADPKKRDAEIARLEKINAGLMTGGAAANAALSATLDAEGMTLADAKAVAAGEVEASPEVRERVQALLAARKGGIVDLSAGVAPALPLGAEEAVKRAVGAAKGAGKQAGGTMSSIGKAFGMAGIKLDGGLGQMQQAVDTALASLGGGGDAEAPESVHSSGRNAASGQPSEMRITGTLELRDNQASLVGATGTLGAGMV